MCIKITVLVPMDRGLARPAAVIRGCWITKARQPARATVIGSIAVIADSPSVKLSTQPVTITVTALGSSIRPASTGARITADIAAQQTMTTQRTVIATAVGAARAAASIAAP